MVNFSFATRSRLPLAAAALALVLTGPAAWQAAGAAEAARAVSAPSKAPVRMSAAWDAASIPRYRHIFVIADVGHDFASIYHNRYAPVINRLASTYGLASRYYTTSDPDVANIVAMLAGSSFGVDDNFPYWDEQISKPSLMSELTAAHLTWQAYYQGLPYPGYLGSCYPVRCNGTPDADTLFTYKHEGVANFSSVTANPAQARNIVPASMLAAESRAGALPNFGLIIPDECADMHGGPPWCEDGASFYHEPNDNRLVEAGDAYVGQVVRAIMAGPQWRRSRSAIVITFTEGATTAGCCGAKPGTGRVMTIVVTSRGPRHLTDATPYNHYSLLATIQHAFGLRCLAHTCDAGRVAPMARLFGGTAPASGLRSRSADSSVRTGADRAAKAVPPERSAPATSPWAQVRSPDVGANDNSLGAIAGRSPDDIWAVGNYLPPRFPDVTSTLAVHYDGHHWGVVPTPNVGGGQNTLLGVTALPDGTAWAVGDYVLSGGGSSRTLIEHWDGSHWSVVPSPSPGHQENLLYGVAATSDGSAWAVGAREGPGGTFRTLIEHWNGSAWTTVPSPDPGSAGDFLYSVTASAGRVFASGQEFTGRAPDRQLILRLDGDGWAVVPGPAGRAFGALASASPFAIAASPGGLWLAGSARSGRHGYVTFVEHGSGSGLRQLASPDPTPQDNYLWAIAPVGGGGSAWAVGNDVARNSGNDEALIEFGTRGGGWRIVPSPSPGQANGGNTILGGVLAFGPHDVWAVGTFDGKNARRTLILHDEGGT